MPLELDKGHDVPVFGPRAKLSIADRLELAREVIRRYGRPGRGSSTRGGRTADPSLNLGRRDRPA